MTGFLRSSFHHHGKFLISLAIGGSAWAAAALTHLRMPFAVGGDVFFLSYIAAFWLALGHANSGYLKNRAKVEDEGAGIVSLIILAAVAYTCTAIFTTLNDKTPDDPIWLAISLVGAPLGWFVIHFNEAAHYSNLYYREHHRGSKSRNALDFHGDEEPGIQDFLYFSLVIGMTSQTSDTNVVTSPMRRAVTWHSVVSFFFNAILIAMAVNAVVSRAG